MDTSPTPLPAWQIAIKNRKGKERLIFHSDQGIQYANSAFADTLKSYEVLRSMSRTRNC